MKAASSYCVTGAWQQKSRYGLVIDVENTHATGVADCEVTLNMLKCRKNKNKRVPVGFGNGYEGGRGADLPPKFRVRPQLAAKASTWNLMVPSVLQDQAEGA